MANLRVKIKGATRIAEIDGATFEEDKPNSELRAKDDKGAVVGRFDLKEIAGWWIEPPTEDQIKAVDLAERIREGRKRVAEYKSSAAES